MKAAITVALLLGAARWATAAPIQTLTLPEAVKEGLRRSPRLLAAEESVRAADARLRAVRADEGPQLGLNLFWTHADMSMIAGSPPTANAGSTVAVPEGTLASAGLMLMVPLYTGGLLSGRTRAAADGRAATEADFKETADDVALEVQTAYLLALDAKARAAAQQARLQAAEAMASNARQRLAAGKGIEAEVRRAEAERADAEAELIALRAEEAKRLLDLQRAMGIPPGSSDIAVSEDGLGDPVTELGLEQWLDMARSRRGLLVAAGLRLRQAESMRSSVAGAIRPQVQGFAMARAFDRDGGMGRTSESAFGITATYPLFDGSQRRARLAEADAELARARAGLEAARLRVEAEVRSAWLDYQAAQARLQAAERALSAAKEAYDTIVVRVENNLGILVDRLDALAALTRAQIQLSQAKYAQHLALARLQRAAGATETPNHTEAKR